MNVCAAIAHNARTQPHAPAVIEPDRAISYAELHERVLRTASALADRGIRSADRVAIRLPNSATHLIAQLALARIGAVSIPLHTAKPADALAAFKARFAPAAVIGLSQAQAIDGVPLILADDDLLRPIPADRRSRPAAAGGEAPFCIALSSGTTGEPKAIVWSHDRLLGHWRLQQGVRAFGPGVRFLPFMGFDAFYPSAACMFVLFGGGAVIVTPDVSLKRLEEAVDRFGATHVLSSPALIARFLDTLGPEGPRFPGLVALRLAGSLLPPQMLRALMRRVTPNIVNDYGSTEAGLTASGDRDTLLMHPAAVGRLMPWVEAQAVADDGVPLPAGTSGVLAFRGAGYPSACFDAPDPGAGEFRDGWFHPGDYGRVLPDGALIIDGRVDEMINLGGTKVAPGEVERVLLQDPDVREAAAYGLETASGQTVLLAAVVMKGAFDEKSLLARCRTQLGQRAPMRLVQVDALPRNDAGKVMRRVLAQNTRVG